MTKEQYESILDAIWKIHPKAEAIELQNALNEALKKEG